MDDRIDELFEALVIEKNYETALSVPYGGYNAQWAKWSPSGLHGGLHGWRYPVGGFDEVYRNKDNKLHRIFGPAYISRHYNIEMWYKDGLLHRDGAPAVTHNNNFFWFREGKLHCLTGPAIDVLGNPKEYYINGTKYSPKEYKKEIMRRQRKGKI